MKSYQNLQNIFNAQGRLLGTGENTKVRNEVRKIRSTTFILFVPHIVSKFPLKSSFIHKFRSFGSIVWNEMLGFVQGMQRYLDE